MFRKKSVRRWLVSALGGSCATRRDVSRDRRRKAAAGTESLELRSLLSAITVNSLADNTTSGDSLVTLREAIIAANTNVATDLGDSGTAGLDTISFAPGLNGTITLSLGAMTISQSLTITGQDAANTIIDANNASRIFFITGGDTTLAKLTLTNGRTTGNNTSPNNTDYTFNGGAILSISSGTLTVSQSTLTSNSTTGRYAKGGAIYARQSLVTVSQSTLSGNSTAGPSAHGGAIYAIDDVSVSQSTFSGNSTAGDGAHGGAINGRQSVSVTQSTLSGNFTTGLNAVGGALMVTFGTVTVRESTLSGNSTAGREARGGAIFGGNGLVSVIQSTFSGNSTAGIYGGGGAISAPLALTISQSTFSDNFTTGDSGRGGAIIVSQGPLIVSQSTITGNRSTRSIGGGIYSISSSITIQNSIIAGNTNNLAPDIRQSPNVDDTFTVTNSLIGTYTGTGLNATTGTSPDSSGNFVGGPGTAIINPQLGPLQDNGGPTFTHALLTSSLAMNHGSNALAVDVTQIGNPALTTDQRGVGFARILGTTVDMGAYEGIGPLSANIVVTDTSLIVGETSPVTITFSEAVTGFDNADLSVANGTLTAFSSADGGITWTAILTPTASVTAPTNVITIDMTGVTGVIAGVGTIASNNYAIDTVRPTSTIVVADASLSIGETSLVTITFSEAVSGFTNADLTIDSGMLSAVSSANGGITWTATFTPTAALTDLINVITLNNTGVTDLAGNAGSGSTSSDNYAIDTARPTATIVVADTSLTIGETSLVTITFSEAVSGFTNAALTIANGALSAPSSADGGTTWTAIFTPTAAVTDLTNVITLNNTGVTDAAGNAGSGSTNSSNFAIDTVRPTATIVVADASLSTGETSLVTITFSEAVTGFGNSDLTIGNGTLSAVSSADGGTTWTATFTPTAALTDLTNVITLDNTGVTDAAGNAGSASTSSNNYAIDTARPTATIVVADTSFMIGETSLVTITFSEAVSGFTNAYLTIGNGTLSAASSADGGTTWTATFTPTAAVTDLTNVITLDNTGVTDAAGNAGSGSTNSSNFAIDTVRPTATIVVADASLSIGETSLVTITFSEAVTGFGNSDLTIGNGTLSAVSSPDGGTTWTATFTPTAAVADLNNVITLDNTGVTDAAGNAGSGSTNSSNFAIDTVRPTATIVVADTSLTIGETTLVTITFSKVVSGFTNSDLTIPNGTLSPVSSADGGTAWSATFTPTAAVADLTNVITLNNTGVTDLAGNGGSATTDSNNYAIDTQRPTATIVVANASLAIGETSLVTITFSEAVSGFTNADLTIADGTLSAVSSADGGTSWTATFTPTALLTDLTSVITLDSTGVIDAVGNSGSGTTDSNNYAIDTVRPTATIVVSGTTLTIGGLSLVTITFSEAVTGFTNVDLTLANGTLTPVTSGDGGLTWLAIFTPTAGLTDLTNVITLENTRVTDLAGNGGTGTTESNNYTIDTAAPTATIVVADASLTIGETSLVTITFSEAVTGLAHNDLTIDNGTLTAVTSGDGGLTWTGTFTPAALLTDLTNVIVLDNTGIRDAAGNAGSGTTSSNNYEIDTRVPEASGLVVTTKSDTADAFDNLTSLREAVTYANSHAGADVITFGSGTAISGGTNFTDETADTITLALGQMVISDSLTITGLSAAKTIIDGNNASRIFNITTGVVTLEKLTLTHGKTIGVDSSGGAVYSVSLDLLTVLDSTLSDNSTTGNLSHGGAVYSETGPVAVSRSTLAGNFTSGMYSNGGAIFSSFGAVIISQSTVSGNSTSGDGGGGGAIFARGGTVTLRQSTLAGNSTSGESADGGAIYSISADVIVNESTLSGNSTTGLAANGGAIYAIRGSVTMSQSTISANFTAGIGSRGGAIYADRGAVIVSQSTLTLNRSEQSFAGAIMSLSAPLTIRNSIVAGNKATGFGPDVIKSQDIAISFTVTNSLIGRNNGTGLATTVGTTPDGNGNFIGGDSDLTKIDPKLGPLANNGGPTRTHALLTGSLAIDHGSNASAVDVTNGNTALVRDQRGVGFIRILDGDSVATAIVDMGAVEFSGLRLTSPSQTTNALRPTLTWTAIAGATSYNIWVSNQSTGHAQYYLSSTNVASQTVTSNFAIGKYRVWIQPVFVTGVGNWSRPSDIFVLPRVVLTAMPKVQLVSRPPISWNALPGAVKYDLWIDNVTTNQSQFVRQDVTGTSFTPSADLPMGIYRVWVRAVDKIGNFGAWSPRYDVQVLPGATPIGPLSATFDRTPTFSWQPVTGAVRYELYVRNSSAINVYNGQSTTATNWTPTVNLPDGQYRWWVVAVNAANFKSGGATVTDLFVGGRPTIVAPVAGSSSSNRTPTFTWKAVDGAVSYNVQVNRIDVAQAKIINVTGRTGTSFTATSALPAGTYRVWVQAVSSTGSSPWSIEFNTLTFTITATSPELNPLDGDLQLTGLLLSDFSRHESEIVPEVPPLPAIDDRDHEDAAIDQIMVQIYGERKGVSTNSV